MCQRFFRERSINYKSCALNGYRKNQSRTRYVYGKGHLNVLTNYLCPIQYCESGIFVFTFNRYPEELKKCIRLTKKYKCSTEDT